jgi:hypothetical protein
MEAQTSAGSSRAAASPNGWQTIERTGLCVL